MISEAIPTEQKKCAYEPEKICTTKCKYQSANTIEPVWGIPIKYNTAY